MTRTGATAQVPAYPLDSARVELLARLVDGLDASALQWVSGYAAGLAAANRQALSISPVPESDSKDLATILHGSQTGNGRRVAEALSARLQGQGIQVRLLRTGEYALRELAHERRLFVVMSTHGDGEPPDDARAFADFLFGRRAPSLAALEFAVLALGDSSYPNYCEIGRRIDERLAELGASRLFPRVDCDVDFAAPAANWSTRAFEALQQARPTAARSRVTTLRPIPVAPAWDRERPFQAELLANQRITVGNDVRDVRHLELSLAGSGLHYEPGDAIGVIPENPPQTVAAVLAAAHLDGDRIVTREGKNRPLADWLTSGLEVTRVTRGLIATIAERSGDAGLAALLQPGREVALREFITGVQLPDLLERHPADWDAEALAGALRPLAPRLYSIASSAREVGEEVHLTVARLDSGVPLPARPGAASHFLATRGDADPIPIYVEPNPRFHLPADATHDVIMIGPGSGVAPFRGFVQERAAIAASGRNWLFFGSRHFGQDFLYQLEWQRALKRGVLHRLDLAISRDRGPRTYVQQRIAEAGQELHEWIEDGAFIYVCGDATQMAPDVHRALAAVLQRHGGLSDEAARERLDRLGAEGRYLRDVY